MRRRARPARAAATMSTTAGSCMLFGPEGEPIAIVPHDQGAGSGRGGARPVGALRPQLLGAAARGAEPRGVGSAVRRLRQMLPAQAGGRRDRRDPPDQRRLQIARPAQRPLHATIKNRRAYVPDCVRLNLAKLSPDRLAARRPAPIACARKASRCEDWHYLISGDPETVHTRRHLGARLDRSPRRMPATSSTILSTATSELSLGGAPLTLGSAAAPVACCCASIARGGGLTLTVPAGTSQRRALAWASSHEEWARDAVAALPARTALAPGATMTLHGAPAPDRMARGRSRRVEVEDDRILCGGPTKGCAARLLRWLRRRGAGHCSNARPAIAPTSSASRSAACRSAIRARAGEAARPAATSATAGA